MSENILLFVNSTLQNFVDSSNFKRVEETIGTTVNDLRTATSTGLGDTIDEQINGFKSITEGRENLSLVIGTQNIPQIQEQIIKDVSAAKTDLEALTGGTIENAFLDLTIAVPTPEGLNAALNKIATINTDQFTGILSNIVPDEFANNLSNVFNQDFVSLTSNLKSSVSIFQNSINNLIDNGSGNPILDVVLKNDQTLLAEIAGLGVNFSQARQIVQLLRLNDIEGATDIVMAELANFTGEGLPLARNEVKEFLENLDVSVSSRILDSSVASNQSYDTQSNTNKWNGAKTDKGLFSVIGTYEELAAELVNSTREITQIVFVGWQTDADHKIDAAILHDVQVKKGLDGINEHYVIRQNGTIQRGRPVNRQSEFLDNHNNYSIVVAVPYEGMNINPQQGRAADMLLKAFYNSWPGGQAFAGQELDMQLTNPGFDVAALVRANGKFNYGSRLASSSTRQLIRAGQEFKDDYV